MPANRRAAQLQEATCEAIINAVRRHLPKSAYREFTLWAFSSSNPRRHEYLQVTGLTQLVTMNVTLVGGLVDAAGWPVVERKLALMNAYQYFETIADNVAMGLGAPVLSEAGRERLELVTAFNRAMIQVLSSGRGTPAVLLLSGHPQRIARRASAFDLSLSAVKHAGIAEEYARHRAGESLNLPGEVEFGLWGALVADIETCRDVADAMDGSPVGELIRDGLVSRYRAVDRTLRAPSLARMELASLGAHSILVAPTLAYGIGVLAEAVRADEALPAVVSDGLLTDVLFDAALLVRLQNDVGTRLLRMAGVQQAALVHRLTRRAVERRKTLAADALALLVEEAQTEAALTRLHKDIANEEVNVALWHARRAADTDGALRAFGESLGYLADLYTQHYGRLTAGLSALDERLGDRRVSTVIERFVKFHERMYAHRYTEKYGEYAI
ncbi:MAG: hypothetical protein HOU81_17045 [Hamadaea sp.]|uniref:hypothetical protein n=1 Tax=Hamadaea sp. TaxID=2024425 RepID=UPI0017D783DC|nr:hypothetical protein [Hamadaea sp.]NUR72525.1 hypothetical protein [Hamadaea sp.]NUT17643.1 hypothetical protein [Hamadaea sp.]